MSVEYYSTSSNGESDDDYLYKGNLGCEKNKRPCRFKREQNVLNASIVFCTVGSIMFFFTLLLSIVFVILYFEVKYEIDEHGKTSMCFYL